MEIDIECVFFCEDLEFWPDGSVKSMHRIIRPGFGFGERTLPLSLRPRFFISLRGKSDTPLSFVVAMGESGSAKLMTTDPLTTTIPSTGFAEICVPCGNPVFTDVGVFVFELRLNGETVYTLKAPLARSRH
jgi:hypothetical protein